MVPFDQGVTKRQKFKIIEENVKQDLEEETPQPFIAIRIIKEEIQTYTFIDFGADGNTISYELYTKLQGAQLTQTNVVFEAYTGHQTKALGCCKLNMFVNELICGDKFFVTQAGMQDVPIILGRSWQRRHNCFFNWERKLVHCQSSDLKLWVPLWVPDDDYAIAI